MKKLLTNLSLTAFLMAIISATPCKNHSGLIAAAITKVQVASKQIIAAGQNRQQDIHPLFILDLRFN